MTWWAWTLLWLVLVLAAAAFLFVAARRLVRQGLALGRELGAATELLARAGRERPGRAARPQDVR